MRKKGFTLIELLIVIGILGILAAIVLVAVDPAKRLRQSRDARRAAEVNSILNAILNYTADSKGILPAAISATTTAHVIGTASTGCDTPTICPFTPANPDDGGATSTPACADLGTGVLVDTYISQIPVDPRGGNAAGDTYDDSRTGYYVVRSSNGRVEVGSCNPEVESSIKVKR